MVTTATCYSTMQSPQILQGIKTINEDMSVQEILLFYGNEGPLVCYYTVHTLEDAFVGKAQVVLEGEGSLQHECPRRQRYRSGQASEKWQPHRQTNTKSHAHMFTV
ncbi:hypothetical protein XENOCAPTIV_008772 [Xenoophorus captivus]|uniref:Uncharacterized protein n=1 Tax=Xenoophorus captivus TaxID=1517983 RepID=A0ABV0RLN0_9TELE